MADGTITPTSGSAHTFLVFRGRFSPYGDEVQTWNRQGVDGIADRVLASRAEVAQFESKRDFASAANLKTAKEAYAALQGQLVTVADTLGNSYTNVLVVSVRVIGESKTGPIFSGGLSSGSTAKFMLDAVWALQLTS